MSISLAWLFLLIAACLDVVWAISMKNAEGYTRLGWSLLSLVALAAFVWLLGRSLSVLPVGTAYAVWTGLGAVGTLAAGALFFGEIITLLRAGSILLILIGVAGLKFSTT